MIVARGMGVGGEEIIVSYGWGAGGEGVIGPSTPTPYGFDLTPRVMRDDIISRARQDEQIDR